MKDTTKYLFTILLAFVAFSFIVTSSVIPANAPKAEAREVITTNVFAVHESLYNGSDLVPAIIDLPSMGIIYCEACGEPCYLEPYVAPITTFDDGTEGVACPFDYMFFHDMTQGERDALRDYWAS